MNPSVADIVCYSLKHEATDEVNGGSRYGILPFTVGHTLHIEARSLPELYSLALAHEYAHDLTDSTLATLCVDRYGPVAVSYTHLTLPTN